MVNSIFSFLWGGQEEKPFIGKAVEIKRERCRGGFSVWQWFEVDCSTARRIMAAYKHMTWTVVHEVAGRHYLDVLGLEPYGGQPDCIEHLRNDLLAANLDPKEYGL